MAAVRTFTLPHYEAYPVQIALFKDVKNAEYLRSQLLAANSDFDYAFLDAAMVSIVHAYSLFTPHLQPHAHAVRRPFPSRNSTLRLCTPQTLSLTPSPLRLIPITFSLAQSALNLNLISLVRALPITSFTFCTPHFTLPVLYAAAGNLQSRCFAARHPPYPAIFRFRGDAGLQWVLAQTGPFTRALSHYRNHKPSSAHPAQLSACRSSALRLRNHDEGGQVVPDRFCHPIGLT
jgi:hypothetical protein